MTALLSLDEQLYTKRCQVNISHILLCTNSLSSLLAFKIEISMSLARDICFSSSSFFSSGGNNYKDKNDIIMQLSCMGLWSQLHLQFIFCSSNFCCSDNFCFWASRSSFIRSSLKPTSSDSTSFSLACKSTNSCLTETQQRKNNLHAEYKLWKAFHN